MAALTEALARTPLAGTDEAQVVRKTVQLSNTGARSSRLMAEILQRFKRLREATRSETYCESCG
jgi:hypothetical protein